MYNHGSKVPNRKFSGHSTNKAVKRMTEIDDEIYRFTSGLPTVEEMLQETQPKTSSYLELDLREPTSTV